MFKGMLIRMLTKDPTLRALFSVILDDTYTVHADNSDYEFMCRRVVHTNRLWAVRDYKRGLLTRQEFIRAVSEYTLAVIDLASIKED